MQSETKPNPKTVKWKTNKVIHRKHKLNRSNSSFSRNLAENNYIHVYEDTYKALKNKQQYESIKQIINTSRIYVLPERSVIVKKKCPCNIQKGTRRL